MEVKCINVFRTHSIDYGLICLKHFFTSEFIKVWDLNCGGISEDIIVFYRLLLFFFKQIVNFQKCVYKKANNLSF